jgi:hypothetical protein
MAAAATNMRHKLLLLLCAAWVAGQVVVPVLQKFETRELRYRYGRHSWAMFGRTPLVYDVSLYVRTAAGRQPIADLNRYVHGLRSPGSVRKLDAYQSAAEVEEWHQRLVQHIAATRRDEHQYVVEIAWLRHFDGDRPRQWTFSCTPERCTGRGGDAHS